MLTSKVNHINALCFAFIGRDNSSLLCGALISTLLKAYFKRALHTIGGHSVRIVRIVVVDYTRCIDITHIVGITNVRRTQPPVPSLQPLPHVLLS